MIGVVRVRGSIGVSKDIKETLKRLNLNACNQLSLVKEENKGMVSMAKNYVSFGEIDSDTLALVLEKRGRLLGDRKISKDFLQKNKFKDFKEMASSVIGGKSLEDFGVKRVFRLKPPRKGFERKGIKKQFSIGGALGYRGKKINELIKKMV